MERYALQNKLQAAPGNYWSERIVSQLLYLEELNRTLNGKHDGLLDAATEKAAGFLEMDGALTKRSAEAVESLLEAARPDAKAIRVACVGHAHIDMNWMWAFDETVSVAVDTLRTMLNLMDEYPDFTFAQSQASVYRIIEEHAPEMLPEIIAKIKAGRWEVTASTWVETDKNMPNGESLTRHLLYTRRYLKKLLGLSDGDFLIDFEPDTFGHNLNVPEILKSGGVRYYYHCRGYEGHSLYKWRAPSGAEITVFREPTWYNDNITAKTFLYIPDYCHENGLDQMLHVYGVGDHGGGATRRDIESILDMARWPCMPALTFGRFADFFQYIEKLPLPVVDRELNFVFNGCYTTQTRIKRANRVAEAALYEAEAFNAISCLYGGYACDTKAFAGAWENVLFNHFHDILPGSGVIDTREYALANFQRAMAVAGTRKAAALRSLAGKINTAALLPDCKAAPDSRAEGAGAGFGASAFSYVNASFTGGAKRLFTVFNPVAADRSGCAELTVWDWDGDLKKIKVTDESGAPLEIQLLDKARRHYWAHEYFRVLVFLDIGALGYRTVLLEEGARLTEVEGWDQPRVDKPDGIILENELVRAVFDTQTAALVSFVDKASGEEHIDPSRAGGAFRFIEEDTGKGMTAWVVGRYKKVEPVAEGVRVKRFVSGDIRQSFAYEADICASRLTVTVSLDKKSRLLKYDVECVWREFGTAGTCIPQLGFYLPLAGSRGEYLQDTAFGTVKRAGMDYDIPAQSFSFAPFEKTGLTLVSDSKYGFRCDRDSMALTLIRSSFDPDPAPECYTHAFSIGVGLEPTSEEKALLDSALLFCHPAVAVSASSHGGELPARGSFLQVDGSAMLSSVKESEDGDGVIIRLYEASGRDGECVLTLPKAVVSAVYVDAHENPIPGETPSVDGRTVRLTLRHNAAAAVKLRF
ncbi:alpha-mannosidase [Clostridia bacterium]|nr:alpha-mannosidase [Clostridia bacterium]